MEYQEAPVWKLRSFCGIMEHISKNLMACGVLQSTFRSAPKIPPGAPKIDPGAPKIEARAT